MAMKIKVIFFSTISLLLFNLGVYSMGEANVEKPTVDLVKMFNLNETNKIVVATEKRAFAYSPTVEAVVTNKNTITEIVDSLQSVKEVSVCDTRPQYAITFYKDAKQLAVLGFFMDNDWFFLRSDHKGGQRDYTPSKRFVEIWKKIPSHKCE